MKIVEKIVELISIIKHSANTKTFSVLGGASSQLPDLASTSWPFQDHTPEEAIWRLLWIVIGLIFGGAFGLVMELYIKPPLLRRQKRRAQRRNQSECQMAPNDTELNQGGGDE